MRQDILDAFPHWALPRRIVMLVALARRVPDHSPTHPHNEVAWMHPELQAQLLREVSALK